MWQNPAFAAFVAALGLALLGLWLVGRTGSDWWFALVVPVFVLFYCQQREVTRANRRATAAWLRRVLGRE